MIALYIGVGILLIAFLFVLLGNTITAPSLFVTYLDTVFEWMGKASGILNVFVPFAYIKVYLTWWLALHALYEGYRFFIWLLSKIPLWSGTK